MTEIIQSLTHIPINFVNLGKLNEIELLSDAFLDLCQKYVTYFCQELNPNKYCESIFESELSERWKRVAIQQAAGIVKSFLANRENYYRDFFHDLESYYEKIETQYEVIKEEPKFKDWEFPILKSKVIQANKNIALLLPSQNSSFDYWLKLSTLTKGQPILIPIKLASYHKKKIKHWLPNSSVLLYKQNENWYLQISFKSNVIEESMLKKVAIDVGCANFITTNNAKHYGTFQGKLAKQHKQDKEKRKRKYKLCQCLRKKNKKNRTSNIIPSLENKKLGRATRQSINHAVNVFYKEHPNTEIIMEDLSCKDMKHKARKMNSYIRASNLAHVPKQIEWGAIKRGIKVIKVPSAYTSQCCNKCNYTHQDNRKKQGTFLCLSCGYKEHADINAAINILNRSNDSEILKVRYYKEIKGILDQRYLILAKPGKDACSASSHSVVAPTSTNVS